MKQLREHAKLDCPLGSSVLRSENMSQRATFPIMNVTRRFPVSYIFTQNLTVGQPNHSLHPKHPPPPPPTTSSPSKRRYVADAQESRRWYCFLKKKNQTERGWAQKSQFRSLSRNQTKCKGLCPLKSTVVEFFFELEFCCFWNSLFGQVMPINWRSWGKPPWQVQPQQPQPWLQVSVIFSRIEVVISQPTFPDPMMLLVARKARMFPMSRSKEEILLTES